MKQLQVLRLENFVETVILRVLTCSSYQLLIFFPKLVSHQAEFDFVFVTISSQCCNDVALRSVYSNKKAQNRTTE